LNRGDTVLFYALNNTKSPSVST